MRKMTREYLDRLAAGSKEPWCNYINVGLSSCGIAAGAQVIYDIFTEEAKKRNLTVRVGRIGCSGACFAEPLIEVCVQGLAPVVYGRVTRDVAIRIIEEHVLQGRLINDYVVDLAVRGLAK